MSEQQQLFTKIFDVYSSYIKSSANMFPIRYREDIIQEGFLGLYHACGAYDISRGTSFDGFAHACIKNQMISGYRVLTKNEHYTVGEEELDNNTDVYSTHEIDSALVKEFFSCLRSKLTHTECKVLNEYLKDKSYDEIAEVLGLTSKKVDNALTRIKRKIKLEYEP